jgi:hypothetical protein
VPPDTGEARGVRSRRHGALPAGQALFHSTKRLSWRRHP